MIEEALSSAPAVDGGASSVSMARLHKAHAAAKAVVAMKADAGKAGQ